MDRFCPRFRSRLWFVGLLLGLLTTAGCTNALFTAMYLLKGTDVEPEFPGLKGKTVAVVCRPLVSLQYQDSRVAKDLALRVGQALKLKGSKIKVIEQRKVEQWTDENNWDDFAEVGKALDAEMVLAIDLEYFHLYQGQTLFQGKANVSLKVIDMKKGKKSGNKDDASDETEVVFEKSPPQICFPPNSCIPTSEKQEAQFRREFILVLAERLSRHFCPHDPHADIAADAQGL